MKRQICDRLCVLHSQSDKGMFPFRRKAMGKTPPGILREQAQKCRGNWLNKKKGFLSADAEEYGGTHPEEISTPAGRAASGIRDYMPLQQEGKESDPAELCGHIIPPKRQLWFRQFPGAKI